MPAARRCAGPMGWRWASSSPRALCLTDTGIVNALPPPNAPPILSSPPTDWSTQRKREYFDWAAQVVAQCRGINGQLDALFDRAYAEGMRAVVFRGGRKRPRRA